MANYEESVSFFSFGVGCFAAITMLTSALQTLVHHYLLTSPINNEEQVVHSVIHTAMDTCIR